MKKYLFIVLITSLIGCSKQTQSYFGTYKSIKIGYIEMFKAYVFNYNYIIRDSLLLNNDSTFELTSCGNIIDGRFKITEDSIFLFAMKNRFRIDSLNKWNYILTSADSIKYLTSPYIKFKIEGNKIISVTERKKLKGKVLNILEKVK